MKISEIQKLYIKLAKIRMIKREKIQYIFIYSVIALLAAAVIVVGVYFILDHQKWQRYRNDPNKKIFIERVESILDKKSRERTVDDYLFLGNNYLNLGENQLALEAFLKALKINPEHDIAALNTANTYLTLGEYKKAEDIYWALIDKNPKNIEPYLKLGELYQKYSSLRGNPESILQKGVENNPENYNLIFALSSYYEKVGNKELALENYKKALELNKDDEGLKKIINDLEK